MPAFKAPHFKAPFAAANVAILVAVCRVPDVQDGSVDSTAFKVGAVFIGGFVARACHRRLHRCARTPRLSWSYLP